MYFCFVERSYRKHLTPPSKRRHSVRHAPGCRQRPLSGTAGTPALQWMRRTSRSSQDCRSWDALGEFYLWEHCTVSVSQLAQWANERRFIFYTTVTVLARQLLFESRIQRFVPWLAVRVPSRDRKWNRRLVFVRKHVAISCINNTNVNKCYC